MRAWTQTFCGRVAVWGHAPPAKIRAPLLGLSTILSATKKPEEGTSEGNSVPNDDQVSNRAAIATLREVSRPLGKQKAEGHVATVRFFDVPSPPVDTFKLHISPPVAILGGYICGMLNVMALVAALPILRESAGISAVGTLLSLVGIANGVGKGLHGAFQGRFSPRTAYIGLLALTATASFAISQLDGSAGFPVIAASICTQRLAASGLWVGASRLIQSHYDPGDHPRMLGALACASRTGAAAASFGSGALLLAGFTWQAIYGAAGVIAAAAAVAISLGFASRARSTRSEGGGDAFEGEGASGAEDDQDRAGWWETARAAWATPMLGTVLVARCGYASVFEMQSFLPVILTDTGAFDAGHAAATSGFFSMGAGATVLVGGALFSRLPSDQGRLLMVGLAGGTAAVLLGASAAVATGAAPVVLVGEWASVLAATAVLVGCLTAVGLLVSTPFYVGVTSWTMRNGGKDVAALEGYSEMMAYGSVVLFDQLVAAVASSSAGWSGALLVWAATAAAAGVALERFVAVPSAEPVRKDA